MRRLAAIGVLLLGVGRSADGRAEALQDPPEEAPAPSRPRAPHPEPRVIVDVLSVEGPHDRDAVERAARLGWGKIVGCYRAGHQRERAILRLKLVISAGGRVIGAVLARSTGKHRDLGECLTRSLKTLAMPRARARSTVHLEIRLAPGDPPYRKPDTADDIRVPPDRT